MSRLEAQYGTMSIEFMTWVSEFILYAHNVPFRPLSQSLVHDLTHTCRMLSSTRWMRLCVALVLSHVSLKLSRSKPDLKYLSLSRQILSIVLVLVSLLFVHSREDTYHLEDYNFVIQVRLP